MNQNILVLFRAEYSTEGRCSNFFKPLKKISEVCPSKQVSAAAMTSMSDEKGELSIVFSVQGTRRGKIRRIGWVIKTLEAQVGQFFLGCKCLVSRSVVVQEQEHLGELPMAFCLQTVHRLRQQR
jgi:hypothetical protein